MRKIPTLFKRDPEDMRRVLPGITPGCEWVLAGEGVATRKYDGTCVLIRRDGLAVHAFARREVKPGKTPPPNFVAVELDLNTGKTVGWEPAEQSGFAKPIAEALDEDPIALPPGTYELCGPKVNRNPENYERHVLVRHESAERDPILSGPLPHGPVAQAFEAISTRVVELGEKGWEGIVWHHPDGRMAKLKARDFPGDPS